MLEDAIDGVTGVWGIGLLAVAGGAFLLTRGGRPAAKASVKGWLAAREGLRDMSVRARSLAAETGERVQDLYAEARAEATGGAGAPTPRTRTAATA